MSDPLHPQTPRDVTDKTLLRRESFFLPQERFSRTKRGILQGNSKSIPGQKGLTVTSQIPTDWSRGSLNNIFYRVFKQWEHL
jgi:hypothetical protein